MDLRNPAETWILQHDAATNMRFYGSFNYIHNQLLIGDKHGRVLSFPSGNLSEENIYPNIVKPHQQLKAFEKSYAASVSFHPSGEYIATGSAKRSYGGNKPEHCVKVLSFPNKT